MFIILMFSYILAVATVVAGLLLPLFKVESGFGFYDKTFWTV